MHGSGATYFVAPTPLSLNTWTHVAAQLTLRGIWCFIKMALFGRSFSIRDIFLWQLHTQLTTLEKAIGSVIQPWTVISTSFATGIPMARFFIFLYFFIFILSVISYRLALRKLRIAQFISCFFDWFAILTIIAILIESIKVHRIKH